MKTMAFDLSTCRGTLALEGEDLRFERDWPNDRRSSAPFFKVLEEAVQAHGWPDLIVVGLGPGSYTGTRIALSAAFGMQLTTGAELRGVSSVAAISTEFHYAVIGDARRSSYFFSEVTEGFSFSEPELLSDSEMRERLATVRIPIYTSDELPHFQGAQLQFPSASLLCKFARDFPENMSRPPLTPIYLREPHITSRRTT